MKREIKFRAFNKFNGEMDYNPFGDEYLCEGTPLNSVLNDFDNVSYSELMQFTGLHDKNGIEIYEGDICAVGGTYVGDYRYEEFTGVIEFDDGQYFVVCKYDDNAGCELCSATIANQDIKVIGNIHKNSDLLK